MKKFLEEFKAFALRGNVMDMAIGVIIGGAFSGIVTSLTDNFINPILNVLTGGATYTLKDVSGFASSFVSSVIMAFILFCLLKAEKDHFHRSKKRKSLHQLRRYVRSAEVRSTSRLQDAHTVLQF